jgi:hypothetical protein
MSGLLSYNSAYQVQSADVGYAILQAGKQGYLTDALIVAATSADDLIADVNAAIVSPGAEANPQRNSIARALKVGQGLGDLSNARVQGATSVQTLAELTWVTNDQSYLTGHLGPNLLP